MAVKTVLDAGNASGWPCSSGTAAGVSASAPAFRSGANDCCEAQADTQILIVDVSDDALERAAGSDRGQAVNTVYCTQYWVCPF
jgi:hypothetical protein